MDEPIRMDVADTPGGATFTAYYYHLDSLGSVMALSNTLGQIAEQYDYDAYGNAMNTSAVGNRYLFTGREYDAETCLYHYRARAHDPMIGRFLQTDPTGFDEGPNLYTYVKNNPVNFTDPTGERVSEWIAAIVHKYQRLWRYNRENAAIWQRRLGEAESHTAWIGWEPVAKSFLTSLQDQREKLGVSFRQEMLVALLPDLKPDPWF